MIKEKEDSLEVKLLQIHCANHEEFRGSVENVLEAMGSAHLLHALLNMTVIIMTPLLSCACTNNEIRTDLEDPLGGFNRRNVEWVCFFS